MKFLARFFLLACFSCSAALAEPASEAAVRKLLEVTQARAVLEGMNEQLRGIMDASVQQALQGRQPNAGQQQAISKMSGRMLTLIQRQLDWEHLEPLYLRLYTQTFTEEEVAGMLAFYETPAGRATIEKMPQVMKLATQESMRSMLELAPRMRDIQKDFIAEMQAASIQH